MERIVVIGGGGHASVVIDAIEKGACHQIVGISDTLRKKGELVMGYPVLGNQDILPRLHSEGLFSAVVVAIGDNYARFKVVTSIETMLPKVNFPVVIHPTAVIANTAQVQSGTVILANAVVNPRCVIGKGCVLNTGSILEHDGVLDDFGSLAPRAVTGGGVCIGQFSAIGIGATVLESRSIGKHTVIGAGAVVTQDFEDYLLAYGVPAKAIKSRPIGEKYLR